MYNFMNILNSNDNEKRGNFTCQNSNLECFANETAGQVIVSVKLHFLEK